MHEPGNYFILASELEVESSSEAKTYTERTEGGASETPSSHVSMIDLAFDRLDHLLSGMEEPWNFGSSESKRMLVK